jgi:hypothetical protein
MDAPNIFVPRENLEHDELFPFRNFVNKGIGNHLWRDVDYNERLCSWLKVHYFWVGIGPFIQDS